MNLENKHILVTGGTGSLGQVLVRRLLGAELGQPARIVVFSRDEAKQHAMRLLMQRQATATDDIIYRNSKEILRFQVGDVRNAHALQQALRGIDIVFNAAALKQVPTCEYFPFEAVQTNIMGPNNLVEVLRESNLPVELVVGISTDKACKPINVMGMTKALQERIFIEANISCPQTRFACVRYGNVIASRGSVVPLFIDQIRCGGPVTITLPEMTRFLLSLDRAVDTIFAAVQGGQPGETYIPQVPSANIVDLAKALMNGQDIPIIYTGIRPGEKVHEIMVSEDECYRTIERDGYYVILPNLPELRDDKPLVPALTREYSSMYDPLPIPAIRQLLGTAGAEIETFRTPAV